MISLDKIGAFARKEFLPLGFFIGWIIAITFPFPGCYVAELRLGGWRVVQTINTCLVFLCSGVTLQTGEFVEVLKKPAGIILGVLLISFVTPVLAVFVKNMDFGPQDFSTGMAIFCVVPTTLGVGVALTQASKGNHALSLLLTVGTNMLGTLTVPIGLKTFLGDVKGLGSVDPIDLAFKLAMTALFPTVLGYLILINSPQVQAFVKKNKQNISMFSALNLQLMVWQSLSAAQEDLLRISFESLAKIIVANIAIHLGLLICVLGVVCMLRFQVKDAVSVAIMASQKSAPVAVTVISYLTPIVSQQGLLSIPCISGQLIQIFAGTCLASQFSKWVEKKNSSYESLAQATLKGENSVYESIAQIEMQAEGPAPVVAV